MKLVSLHARGRRVALLQRSNVLLLRANKFALLGLRCIRYALQVRPGTLDDVLHRLP